MEQKISKNDYVKSIGRPWYFCKWWLKCETYPLDKDPDGFTHGAKIYVPWWAWPLELLHRLVFGYPKLEAAEQIK